MYFRYLAAAFGSALIFSIYGAADMAMVGPYQGPSGTAALAVVNPVWNIISSRGLLMGIGGSVLFSTLRGESEENRKKSRVCQRAEPHGTALYNLDKRGELVQIVQGCFCLRSLHGRNCCAFRGCAIEFQKEL